MLTQLAADIYDANQSQIKGIQAYNGVLYTCTAQPAFRSYDLTTLAPLASGSGIASTPSGIALISTASAIIVSNGAAQVDWVQVATGARSGITSGAATTQYSQMPNQVAGNINTGYALATKSTTGSVTLINGLAQTCSSMPVTPLSGQNATCVTNKDSNFLIGTTNMQIHELSIAGSLIKSMTLASTPSGGVAIANLRVGSIAYSNGYVLAIDTHGIVHLINWATSTVVDRVQITAWDLNTGSALSPAVSGVVSMTGFTTTSNVPCQAVYEVYIDQGQIAIQDCYFTNQAAGFTGSSVDPLQPYTATMATLTTTGPGIRVFRNSGTNKVNIPTWIQDPPGVVLTGRAIRIRDNGMGRKCVESDTSIPAAVTNIAATDGSQYIEIALTTSPNKWGVREFKA